jgi:photosystem II stability/assembly factor-like uncharacterized protein
MKKLIIYSNLILLFFSNICASQDYWELVNSPDSVSIFDIAVDSEGSIYLACPFSTGNLTGIYRSDDNCETWHRKVTGMYTTWNPITRSVAIDDNGVIISGANSIIYRSQNHGDTWQEVYNAVPQAYTFNIAVFGYDSIFLVGGGNDKGIIRSGDNGLTWQPVLDYEDFDPIYEEVTTGICFGPDGDIYACSRTFVGGYGSVYISKDLGLTWSVFFNNESSQFRSIGFDQNGKLLVGTFGGLYRFDFQLENWEFHAYNMVPVEMLMIGDSSIYLACDEESGGVGGVVFSNDIGETYEILNSGMEYPDANNFAIDGVGRILVSGTGHRLFRSYDTLITGLENINDVINGEPFSCYPNPYKISTSINANIDKPSSLIIYSSVGNIVTASSLEPFGTYILREDFPKGIYIAVLITEDFKTVIKIIHF